MDDSQKSRVGILVYPGWENALYYNCLYQGLTDVNYAQYHGAFFALYRNFTPQENQILHLHWTADLFAVTEKRTSHFLIRFIISLIDLVLVKFVKKANIVWTVHNLYAHNCKHRIADKLGRILLGKLANRVIVQSAIAHDLVIRAFHIPSGKIHIIPHGHFIDIYPNIITREDARKKLNINPYNTVYLFFGGLSDYKGADDLVRAFNELPDSNSILLIAGKNAKSVTHLITNQNIYVFDGFIPDSELQIYMNAADWVVLPYKQILTSASLITAMGFHKAVIIPQMGTLPDYMHPNGGIIYKSEEKDCLLSALRKSSQMNAQDAGEKNFIKILEFNWHIIQNQTKEIYKSILNE